MGAADLLKETDEHMQKSIEAAKREFSGVRTGKASAGLLDVVRVDYYGQHVPLRQVATVTAPEPRLITVTPYDKSMVSVIEKAIRTSDLGLNPATDGGLIRVPIPALTEERRKEFVKLVRGMAEHGRVAVRNVRHHAHDRLKAMQKDGEITEDELKRDTKRLQDMTDLHIKKLDDLLKGKEADIMEV